MTQKLWAIRKKGTNEYLTFKLQDPLDIPIHQNPISTGPRKVLGQPVFMPRSQALKDFVRRYPITTLGFCQRDPVPLHTDNTVPRFWFSEHSAHRSLIEYCKGKRKPNPTNMQQITNSTPIVPISTLIKKSNKGGSRVLIDKATKRDPKDFEIVQITFKEVTDNDE